MDTEQKRGFLSRVYSSVFNSLKAPYIFILGLVFLFPIFFIPSFALPIGFVKNTFLGVVVIGAFLFWLIARLKEGKLVMPRNGIIGTAFLSVSIFFLASLFSGAIAASLFGVGYETGTFFSFLILFLLLFLSSVSFRSKDQVLHLYAMFIGSVLIMFLYHGLRFVFGPDILSFSVFTNPASTPIGKWNDLSILFGLSTIFSLLTLQMLSVRRIIVKTILYGVLILSLFFLAVIDFTLVWVLVGLFSLVTFVYGISFRGIAEKKHDTAEVNTDSSFELNNSRENDQRENNAMRVVPIAPIVVAVMALLFLLPGSMGSILSDKFGIVQIEARPSWSSTLTIGKETLKTDLFLGAGLNRFANQWSAFKPDAVNTTSFWSTDFNFGIGIAPSLIVMTGLLGVIAWLTFMFVFVYKGIRNIFIAREDTTMQYLIVSSFVFALYLWVVTVFYVPGIVNVSLAFIFTGVFVALLSISGASRNYNISFLKNPRVGFASVLFLVLFIIASVIGEYFVLERYTAAYLHNKGLYELNVVGDVNVAERDISRASTLYESDLYYRALAETQILLLRTIVAGGGDQSPAQFQGMFSNAIINAQQAIAYDKSNYLNFVTQGRVYGSVVSLGIEGAYERAIDSYARAKELSPKDPSIEFALAQIELSRNNIALAREHITNALELKGNYTAAIFLLAQIEANEGNIDAAIQATEQASFLSPNDIGIFFQLGFLRYKNDDYEGAVSALERTVSLNPVYANARYFLGLSYDKLGRGSDAIAQFEEISLLNPDNQEVKDILSNLKRGRSPFANIAPPLQLPEDREEPPIEE